MVITHLKVNHLVNPIGFDLGQPTVSYVAEETNGKKQVKAQVLVSTDKEFTEMVYDSGEKTNIVSTAFVLPVSLKPETRYFWKVRV